VGDGEIVEVEGRRMVVVYEPDAPDWFIYPEHLGRERPPEHVFAEFRRLMAAEEARSAALTHRFRPNIDIDGCAYPGCELTAGEHVVAERDAYRIEADCAMRDHDGLMVAAEVMYDALRQIAEARPNKAFDPWARELAQAALAQVSEQVTDASS
jgi:hypothetical protein